MEAYKYLKAWRLLASWLEDKHLKARRLLVGWLDRWVPGCHTPHSAVAFPHTHSQNWARHKDPQWVHNIRHQRVKDKYKARALCKEALLAPRINHGWGCGKMPESVRNEKCKVQNGASTFITITKWCLNVHCNKKNTQMQRAMQKDGLFKVASKNVPFGKKLFDSS